MGSFRRRVDVDIDPYTAWDDTTIRVTLRSVCEEESHNLIHHRLRRRSPFPRGEGKMGSFRWRVDVDIDPYTAWDDTAIRVILRSVCDEESHDVEASRPPPAAALPPPPSSGGGQGALFYGWIQMAGRMPCSGLSAGSPG